MLVPLATESYARISNRREELSLRYLPGAGEDFAAELERTQPEETRLRQTLIGPHRDELELRFDGIPAAQFGSEGQQRSAALALKIAQARAFQQSSESGAPVLLIDDVFGELDEARRHALLDNLPSDAQKLVTATALPWRDAKSEGAMFKLRDRQLERG
jgi:DNA replication and repair protein RecF